MKAPPPQQQQQQLAPSPTLHQAPHLLGSLLRPFGTLDAAVARDHDGDLARLAVGDLEALRVERRQEHLQTHQVFEFEVANGGLALAELLDEFAEAVADPLPGHKVVFLDLLSHAPGQKGLVAASGGWELAARHQLGRVELLTVQLLTWCCCRCSQVTGPALWPAASCPEPPGPDTPPGPRGCPGWERGRSRSRCATRGGGGRGADEHG